MLPDETGMLELDKEVELEGEKKIFNVVENLIRYLPGFKKIIPLKFLMADEHKWLSNARLRSDGRLRSEGVAIHELVRF